RASAGSILIVEDDHQLRALHCRMIAEHFPSYTIRDAGDGRAALAILGGETPSLIVLDLVMPEIHRFSVLDAPRAHSRTAMIRVLVLSGKLLSADDIRRLAEARVIYHTKEMLAADELAESFRRALIREEILPPHTSALVKQAVGFIQQNYGNPIALQEIAD